MSGFLERHRGVPFVVFAISLGCVVVGFISSIVIKAVEHKMEVAQASEPLPLPPPVKMGYVVQLDAQQHPSFCWPVKERHDNDWAIAPIGNEMFCFNGSRRANDGEGATCVHGPVLTFDPSPKEQGDTWLAGLGIVSCPGGRLP